MDNSSGVDWLGYNWAIPDGAGAVWFDTIQSLPFGGVDPSTERVYSDTYGFGDPAMATDISLYGGIVPNGSSFDTGPPPGRAGANMLVLETDLSGTDPVSFTFAQFPIPEPLTILLLSIGAGYIGAYRRPKR